MRFFDFQVDHMLYWRFHFEKEVPINCLFTQWKWTYILEFGPWEWSAFDMDYMDKRPSFLGKDNGHEGQNLSWRTTAVHDNLARAAWAVRQKHLEGKECVGAHQRLSRRTKLVGVPLVSAQRQNPNCIIMHHEKWSVLYRTTNLLSADMGISQSSASSLGSSRTISTLLDKKLVRWVTCLMCFGVGMLAFCLQKTRKMISPISEHCN